ncbi:MAG: hypothetical protein SFU21_05875 [Flavihumibacter sp.]|nr:hypothetical protein [Flavihumibacter sp.]
MMKKNLPFFSGALFIAVTVAAIQYVVLKSTGGVFCYPLDDTFIHMAVSDNIAQHGVWGITPAEFTSTSSSPFFTLLLAASIKIFGNTIFLPIILSSIGTLIILLAMQQELNRFSALTVFNKILTVITVLIVGALPALTLLGMEHTLQIGFTLLYVHAIASYLHTRQPLYFKQALLFGFLMVFTRYENSFFIAGSFALLVWQKQWKQALIVAVMGALPILLFGLYAKSQGGFFIPNSVMIKANQNLKFFFNGGASILETAKSITGLIVVCLLLAVQKLKEQNKDRDFWILCLLVIAGVMHGALAQFGWFYRYEAYIIVLGTLHLTKMGLTWWQQNGWIVLKKQWVLGAVFFLLLFNLPLRGANSFRNSIRAIYNIYEQQYQMALFMQQFYKGQTVAANDIGAITYYAKLNTIDLWGLGNNKIADARKNFYWNNDFLQQTVKTTNTRVAVIYDSWFDKDLTKPWHKVATWEMPYNYICGDIKVTFYGITETEAATLKNNLAAFQSQLPRDIKVEYFR